MVGVILALVLMGQGGGLQAASPWGWYRVVINGSEQTVWGTPLPDGRIWYQPPTVKPEDPPAAKPAIEQAVEPAEPEINPLDFGVDVDRLGTDPIVETNDPMLGDLLPELTQTPATGTGTERLLPKIEPRITVEIGPYTVPALIVGAAILLASLRRRPT
jgi:hypothetical protein